MLKDKIASDLKDALKSGDNQKRDTLRFLQSAIKNVEIEKRKQKEGLTDEEVIEVIARSMKQRRESVEQFEKGGRPELAEKEKKEMEILSLYLPEQLGEEDIKKEVLAAISESGAKSPGDMGRVMGAAMKKLKGRADGNAIKKIVEEELKKMV